jgi:LPS-assembly protein
MKILCCIALVLVFMGRENGLAADSKPMLHIRALGESAELIDGDATTVLFHTNGVEVTYQDATLTATRVSIDKQTGAVLAEGLVRLQRGTNYWVSESLEYNFLSEEIKAQQFRTAAIPLYIAGFGLKAQQTNKIYSATNSFITTDDNAQPGYRIRAREVVIKPGDYVEARGATIYMGRVPVFYVAHYRRDIKKPPQRIALTPGISSRNGAYLLSELDFNLTQELGGTLNLDYRQERGVGVGPDFEFDYGKWGQGTLETYYAHDMDPETDSNGEAIAPDRSRVYFTYQTILRTNLTFKGAVRWQTDERVTRDFFESDYRRDPKPDSFFELNQLWPNFSLNVLTRPQVNDFFETVERLPDIKFSGFRQQLGQSPLYYESESSAGYLTYRSASLDNADFAAFRADTLHQVFVPRNFFGWLNVNPRVGGRYTYYSEAHGSGATTEEQQRWVFNTGAEISTKASQTWPHTQNKFWDLNGLRHIVEPSVNYVFVPSPSTPPRQLPQFDQEFASFRLVPIEYPDYNAIDSVDSQNVVRLSLRNMLQTKRLGRLENLADWALYTDCRLDPDPDQSTLSDVFSDFEMYPRSWLRFISQTRFNTDNGQFNMADHYISFEPSDRWSYGVGHRFLRDDSIFGPDSGHDLVLSRLFLKLNEDWAVRLSHLIDSQNGILEEQYYSLYRDFRSWTGALTFRVRNEREGKDDFTVAFTMSLKAFPKYHLGDDKEVPSLLLGR